MKRNGIYKNIAGFLFLLTSCLPFYAIAFVPTTTMVPASGTNGITTADFPLDAWDYGIYEYENYTMWLVSPYSFQYLGDGPMERLVASSPNTAYPWSIDINAKWLEWEISEPQIGAYRVIIVPNTANGTVCNSSLEGWNVENCVSASVTTPATYSYLTETNGNAFSVMSEIEASQMVGAVYQGVKDTGVNLWLIVALAVSIPLTFWGITEIIYLLRP